MTKLKENSLIGESGKTLNDLLKRMIKKVEVEGTLNANGELNLPTFTTDKYMVVAVTAVNYVTALTTNGAGTYYCIPFRYRGSFGQPATYTNVSATVYYIEI